MYKLLVFDLFGYYCYIHNITGFVNWIIFLGDLGLPPLDFWSSDLQVEAAKKKQSDAAARIAKLEAEKKAAGGQ